MKWLYFIGILSITACGSSRIRLVKVGEHSTQERYEIPHQPQIKYEQSSVRSKTSSSSVQLISDSLNTTTLDHLIVSKGNTEFIEPALTRAAPVDSAILAQETVSIKALKKTPERYIRNAHLLLVISTILLFIAFLLLIVTISGGFGLPFIYVYLSSLIPFIIGSIQLKKGYKTFQSATVNKETLYQKYHRTKILQIVLEVFMGLWLILLVVFLILPLIQLGAEIGDFIFSGGINFNG